MGTKARLTADDLWRLPETECRRELVNGEVVEMPPPGALHGEVTGYAYGTIEEHVRRHGLGKVVVGDVGFVLRLASDHERVRAPDVAFIAAGRVPEGGLPVTFFDGPPDVAVEVLSASEISSSIAQKVRDYLEAGCRLVLVVAAEARTITLCRPDGSARLLRNGDELEAGEVLPGFRAQVSAFFD